jgi:hypothetical protein
MAGWGSDQLMRTLCAVAVVFVGSTAVASTALAAPANDDFVNAAPLENLGNSVFGVHGDSTAATPELGEPQHAGVSGGASVWYRWTAPGAGHVNARTCNATFDTLLAVYTGSAVSALTPVASNDNGGTCGGTRSGVDFSVAQGATYEIAVDGVGGAQGEFDLFLDFLPDSGCCATPPARHVRIKKIRVNSRKRTATAFLTTDLAGASFICQLDVGNAHPCGSRVTFGKRKPWAKLKPGKHQLVVTDTSGRSQQPALAHFTIKAR